MIYAFLNLLSQAEPSQIPTWGYFLAAIITSGTLTSLLTIFFNMKKTSAEKDEVEANAADIIQRAAGQLIDRIKQQADSDRKQYLTQIEELSDQNKNLIKIVEEMQEQVSKIPELEKMVQDLTIGVHLLTQQLVDHGVTPVYPPMPPQSM